MSNPLRQIEWRSLIEVAGPFLADAVLEKAFPQGLEKLETPRKQRVRSAYDEWCEAVEDSDPQLAELHGEWLRLVLEDLLEYDATVLKAKPEFPETIRYQHPQTESPVLPDMVVMAGDKPRLLITTLPPGTKLESPLTDQSWPASPLERMTLLCRASEVSLGLVTNGEQWTLVSAPAGETSSTASWFARIWQQEPVTLQAFQSLLGVRRMFGPANETFEALLLESLQHLDEVTDTLGSQVRRAVEVLVQALDRADLDRDRHLLKDVSPAELYEAGLTVMMRLVFTLCAEERKLLLLGEPIYDQHYAISTLRARLNEDREQLGEDVLERRHDAWSRLLAVFRAIYGGIEHETLRLPPLGGSIFDPDRYPFLEGRASGTRWVDTPASPLPIDNRTVLLLLNALQVLEQRTGARLLSYLALDVEQIGHVYEGLLERTVKKVPETTLGLIGSQKAVSPNVSLHELEEQKVDGEDRLMAYVLEKTERSETGVRNALAKPLDEGLYHRILLACGGDIALTNRIKPFALLLRSDNWGDPLVYRENAYMVTLGAGRRETGTHYTPKSLTEPVVQHTLEPLAYIGPAEGKPREEWRLRTPAELLALKICDMAMGSGAFLVQVCRWLAERLVEAWDAEEKAGRAITIEGAVLDLGGDAELLPRDQAERVLIARRLIASRCLYGVDKNPMAVELAKLSLWLITMMRNRPFSFLDHALKCGDSIIGISRFKQLERFSVCDPDHAQPLLETANLWRHIEQAAALRRELETMPSHTAAQIAQKARLHVEAETQLAQLRAAADFLVAAELSCADGGGWDTRRAVAASRMQLAWKKDTAEFQRLARVELDGHRPFHWPLEFPEIFKGGENGDLSGGFDAFVGNPPFLGGKRISIEVSATYEKHLKRAFQAKGAADICCYFFRRGFDLLKQSKGTLGLLATNSITEGDSPAIGLEPIVESGGAIFRARPSFAWPGEAGVFVAQIHIFKGSYLGLKVIENEIVQTISCKLSNESDAERYKLKGKLCPCSAGRQLYGQGFIIDGPLANRLRSLDPRNAKVIKPYFNSDIFNASFDFSSPLWGIDFGEMEEDVARQYAAPYNHLVQTVKPIRDKLTKQIHEDRFWLYWDKRAGFFAEAAKKRRILVCGRHTAHLSFLFFDSSWVLTEALQLFCADGFADFGLLQSSIHEVWARKYSSTIGEGLRYSSSDAFDTFSPPRDHSSVGVIAQSYYEARQKVMLARREGLTATYNRFHDPDPNETADDIDELRNLHRQLDAAVVAAYGWADLAAKEGTALRHDFHETKQGVRWTLHPDVRSDILDRLLALNHERHAEEVAAGLHNTAGKKRSPNGKRKSKQIEKNAEPNLFE